MAIRGKIYLIISFLCSQIITAQNNQADLYFETGYYIEASNLYEKILKNNELDYKQLTIIKNLSESYFKLRDFNNSYKWFKKSLEINNNDSLSLFRLFQLSAIKGDYVESKLYLDLFFKNKSGLVNCFDQNEIIQDKLIWPKKYSQVDTSINVEILNLELYTYGMGYSFYNENKLILGVNRNKADVISKTNFYQLAVLDLNDTSNICDIVELEEDNGYYIAYPSYNELDKILIYTSNGSNKKKFNKKKANKFKYSKHGENTLKIYSGNLKDNTLININELNFCNDNFNYTHPSISNDGKLLFFVSDQPGGYGGYDIYYTIKNDSSWSNPINCGPKINSCFNETTPFIFNDVLYFSSYGHNGYGGSDIFKSTIFKLGEFSTPQNLGKPINSNADDFGYTISTDETYALITSNRMTDDEYKDHLYKVRLPKRCLVFNKINQNPVKDVKVSTPFQSLYTDKNGVWRALLFNSKDMWLTFDNPWYETLKYSDINVSDSILNLIDTVFLSPIILNGKVVHELSNEEIQGVKITLFEKDSLNGWVYVKDTLSDQNGNWSFHVRKDKEYKVSFQNDQFIDDDIIISRYDQPTKLRDDIIEQLDPFKLSLKPKVNMTIQFNKIYFKYAKYDLEEKSMEILDNIYDFLNKNQKIKIELSAHTDCIGGTLYNKNLSQKRAESCFKYLVKKGIHYDRIIPKGYGESKMIVKDCDLQKANDKEAQKNRRVEVKILSND